MRIRKIFENILFVLISAFIIGSLFLVFVQVPFVDDNNEKEEIVKNINISEADYPTTIATNRHSSGFGDYHSIDIANISGVNRPEKLLEEHNSAFKFKETGKIEFEYNGSKSEIEWKGNDVWINDTNSDEFYITYNSSEEDVSISSNPENSRLTNNSLFLTQDLFYSVYYLSPPAPYDSIGQDNAFIHNRIIEIINRTEYRAVDAEKRGLKDDLSRDFVRYEDREDNIDSSFVLTEQGRIARFSYYANESNERITYETKVYDNEPFFKPVWKLESES